MFKEISLSDVMFASRNSYDYDASDALEKAIAKHDSSMHDDLYKDEVEQLLSEFGY